MRDFGVGISEEDRKSIFQPYFKTKDIKSKKFNAQSHGIGLSYCKRLAKGLGGDLVLNDTIRDGCEFQLHLILKKLDAPAPHINFLIM